MKFLSQVNKREIYEKTCLLRLDLNVENQDIVSSIRIKRALPTLRYLVKNKCKIIIVGHRGRPVLKSKSSTAKKETLNVFVALLEKELRKKIRFENKFDFVKIKSGVKKSPVGSVFLLENIRFLKGEQENDLGLARNLASLGDFYINDAFAVCHRKDVSVSLVSKFIPSYAGMALEEEITNLSKLTRKIKKPLVLIIGGAKVSDKIGLIKNFYKKSKYILTGGAIANTFFHLKRIPVGNSLIDRGEEAKEIFKKYSSKIILPTDVVLADGKILDIGEKTTDVYSSILKKAGTIIWNGPVGLIENKKYQKGTAGLIRAVIASRAFSVVGGGETTSFILKMGKGKSFSFLSAGGGAMLEYLSGNKLPGIEALKKHE